MTSEVLRCSLYIEQDEGGEVKLLGLCACLLDLVFFLYWRKMTQKKKNNRQLHTIQQYVTMIL